MDTLPDCTMAATIQAMTAMTMPHHAASTAPVADASFHVMSDHRGHTAEPMQMPMNRYTQPRLKPIMLRITESTPMAKPYTTITMREIRLMSSPLQSGLK